MFENRIINACLRILGALMLGCAPIASATAQVETVDPDKGINADIAPLPSAPTTSPQAAPPAEQPVSPGAASSSDAAPGASPSPEPSPAQGDQTYRVNDLVNAAEGVFGKGAKGLAELIEDLLKKQGEPNGYIVGREAGGALVVGLRYGSGKLHHKIEGEKPVFWTGPSIGFDAGANAAQTFVLVYNLYNTDDIYKRFAAAEGQAYLVGGFHVSYLRRGDIVIIPVRTGAGLRLGVNAGYMKFSKKVRWVPF